MMKKKQNKTRHTLLARAKINLDLRVGALRKDGYHSLRTLFQEISLHDRLSFRKTPRNSAVRLRVKPRTVPSGRDNLIVKALELLQKHLRARQGMDVRLMKRIPVGAGLGGGSSDAAAALWGGWLLWDKKAKSSSYRKRIPPLLKRLASRLGADVAFFLKGGRAEGRGVGDRLRKLPAGKKKWIVLVCPKCRVSTAKAYKWLDASRGKNRIKLKFGLSPRNDFESVIFKKFPAIAKAKGKLVKEGCANVMMSGSGSAVFGFVPSQVEGRRVIRALSRRPSSHRFWDVFLTQTV